LKFDVDFADMLIKGRNVKGNLVTKYAVKRVELKEEGVSTLKPRRIWFDETVKRLNVDERGELLGEFKGEDRILIVTQDAIAKTIVPELTTRFDEEMVVLEKWMPKKPISAIYWEAEKERFYVKRFLIENPDREEKFISDHENSYLEFISTDFYPQAEIVFSKLRGKEQRENEEVNLEEFISVKGIKALGNQLTAEKIKQINPLDPLPYEEEEEVAAEDIEVVEEESVSEDKNKINIVRKKEDSGSSENQTKLFDE
jgi:topoisomerase-4 subunit A